ncbi:hypothetical protein CH289_07880 [Rhodococcus sp. RS1C4]|nr:hypothetical protein [Rhodococcus sp. RS1C4]OZC55101.1 hypothetical protein CH289_07880 [Rhodococcus sp. RS1C4]
MTNTAAPTTNRHLTNILAAHDMIAHADANTRGATFDGWVRYAHIAEYVDIAEADIIDAIDTCAHEMTSPTHKVTALRPDAFQAERI